MRTSLLGVRSRAQIPRLELQTQLLRSSLYAISVLDKATPTSVSDDTRVLALRIANGC
jgi:hypothetical protein